VIFSVAPGEKMLRLAVIYNYDAHFVKTKHHRCLFLY
jgi:hypothetical protein